MGLSWKVFVSFSDLPHCIIPVYEFFFSQKFCLSQIRPVPDISAEEKRLLEVSGRAWNLFSTIKAGTGKPPLKFQVDLATAFLPDRAYHADDAPTVAWTLSGSLSSAAAAWSARACGSSKCPRAARSRRTTSKLELQLFLMSSSVFVACMPHRDDDRSTVTLTTRETRWCLLVHLSPWLKAIAKFFKGIWVSRLWSCLGLRRSAALVTDSPTCDFFFTRWVLCFCFEENENWWVLCCSVAG